MKTSTQGHNWERAVVDNAKTRIATECRASDGNSLNDRTHAFSLLRRLCKLKNHRIHGKLDDIARRHGLTRKKVQSIAEGVLVEYHFTQLLKVPEIFDRSQYRQKKKPDPQQVAQAKVISRERSRAALKARLKDAQEVEAITGRKVYVDKNLDIQVWKPWHDPSRGQS